MNECQLIVTGSSEPINRDRFLHAMNSAINHLPNARILLREGNGAVDKMARDYVVARGLPYEILPADWNKLGNSAGVLRNVHMAQYATHALLFWDGYSFDIKNLIAVCEQYGVKKHIVYYDISRG